MGGGVVPPPAHIHEKDDGQQKQRKNSQARKCEHDKNRVERDAPHLHGLKVHKNL